MNREQKILVSLVAAAVAGVLLVDWVHVSDEERVERVIRNMADAVREKNLVKLFSFISQDYSSAGMDREALRVLVAVTFERYEMTGVRVSHIRLSVSGRLALAEVDVRADASRYGQYRRSGWQVSLAKETGDAWRVTSIDLVWVGDYRRDEKRSLRDLVEQ